MQPSTVVAGVELLEEELRVEALPHQAALHVGEGGDDGVDRARLDVRPQFVDFQHEIDPIARVETVRPKGLASRAASHDQGGWMSSEAPGTHAHDDDARMLHKLGYAQVLYREMGGFANFAISFTIISILAGCLTSYYIAFQWGGPVAITWGWLIVGSFCIIVALAMGEIASTYPTAGGLYFWASKLGSPAWGWFTGWFNLIGQIAVTAAIDYGAAIFTTSLLNLWFPGTIPFTRHAIFVTFTMIIALHLLLNLLGVKLLAGAELDLGVVAHGRRRGDRARS